MDHGYVEPGCFTQVAHLLSSTSLNFLGTEITIYIERERASSYKAASYVKRKIHMGIMEQLKMAHLRRNETQRLNNIQCGVQHIYKLTYTA
jgi:hypothetical protein